MSLRNFLALTAPKSSFKQITFCKKAFYSSKIPETATWKKRNHVNLPEPTIDDDTIYLLQRLALVGCSNRVAVEHLKEAIKFADVLKEVDTTGVEPMETVLEERSLYLRDDVVIEGQNREDILKNAAKTVEEYFVAPPGNIPLKREDSQFRDDDRELT